MSDDFRIEGAIGATAGGLFLVLGHLLNYIGTQPTGTTAGKSLVFAGHVVLVFAFIGLHAHQRRYGRALVGRIGMVLSTVGTVLVSAIVFVELAGTSGVDTTPVFEAAGASVLYTVGPLVFVLGMLSVGASILKRHDLPRVTGGLLILGTVVFAGASVIADFAALLTVAGAVLTAAGFIRLGIALYTQSASRTDSGNPSSDD